MRALQIAATGMAAQQMRVEVISNNLANMNTTGYNARRAEFADLHYQQMTKPGTINAADGTVVPAGIQLGLGVRPAAISVQLAQGPLAETGGDLDELTDTDRESTRQLYKLVFDVVRQLAGGLQVIALDHADFEDEWFATSVIQRWREGDALIPADWI